MFQPASPTTLRKLPALVINSYAKLNLYLEVLNKRKDSFHNIKTIFERIDLCDKIILKGRQDKKIKIICNSPDVPKDRTNLAYRSVKLLQNEFNLKQGVDIRIIKRIPVGSGLAGGSSNAAAVLLGLDKLWKLNLSRNKLLKLAKRIGSDVPFFLYPSPFAQGEARGDCIRQLRCLDKIRLWHILVVPKIKVATSHVYKEWDKHSSRTFGDIQKIQKMNLAKVRDSKLTPHLCKHSKKNNKDESGKGAGLTRPRHNVKILTLALKKRALPLIGEALFNRLESITANLYPEVKKIKARLKSLGLKSILMSGSGPAIFGIVSSRKEALSLCRQLQKDRRFWQVFVTRTGKYDSVVKEVNLWK
jgi:4-diphosphocytidyl-2-C-methyl-D-erythritol kinase